MKRKLKIFFFNKCTAWEELLSDPGHFTSMGNEEPRFAYFLLNLILTLL